MKNFKLFLVILLVLGLFLAGCGKKEADESNDVTKIAVIPKGTTHEFWKTVHAGAARAAEEFGVEISWKGPVKEDDRNSQISIVEDMTVRGVDGIVLAPLDDTALRMPVSNAVRQGIPVVIFDSDLKSKDHVSFVATDNYEGGRKAGEYLAAILNEKGKAAVLRYAEGSASTLQREKGFLEAVEKYPDIEVVSSNQYAGATTESAMKAAENLFARFKDEEGRLKFDGMFCSNESVTVGTLQALKTMAADDDVKIVGFDSSQMFISALKEGRLSGFVVQNPFNMGYMSVKTIVEYLNGKKVPRRIDTGSTLITPESIDDPDVQYLLNPPVDKWLNNK